MAKNKNFSSKPKFVAEEAEDTPEDIPTPATDVKADAVAGITSTAELLKRQKEDLKRFLGKSADDINKMRAAYGLPPKF